MRDGESDVRRPAADDALGRRVSSGGSSSSDPIILNEAFGRPAGSVAFSFPFEFRRTTPGFSEPYGACPVFYPRVVFNQYDWTYRTNIN